MTDETGRDDRPASVTCVSVGPEGHGVVRHGRAVARALRGLGLDVQERHAPDAAAFGLLGPELAAVVRVGGTVHVDVTDALFGASPDAAADLLTATLPPGAAVTLHDVPQPAEGADRFRRRAAAYTRIARHAADVVVSSEHERRLLTDIVDVPARVVPLPVDDRRDQAAADDRTDAAGLLPEELSGLGQDVVVFGFLYPGKGHREAIDALAVLAARDAGAGLPGPGEGRMPAAPRRVTALGPVADGHDDLVEALRAHAAANGLRFRVTGRVPDDLLDAALRAAGVPVAAHRNVSASGSLNSWIGAGRRVVVPEGRYTAEMERLRPGTLRLVAGDGPEALAEAIAEAAADPVRTRLGPEVRLAPGPRECARLLAGPWDAAARQERP